jgi:chromosome segregation ATPase
MSPVERWDMVERLLREAEEALRTPPRDAANGHARVQGAQAEVARLREQHRRAVAENEKLRLQVAALENDGMELAAKLGEAEERIARLTAAGGRSG